MEEIRQEIRANSLQLPPIEQAEKELLAEGTLKTYRLNRLDFVDVKVVVRAFNEKDALERAKRGYGEAVDTQRSQGDYVGDTEEVNRGDERVFDETGLREQMGTDGFVGVIQINNDDRARAYVHAQCQILDELSANNGSLDISLLSDSKYFFGLFAREIAANLGISEQDAGAGLLDALSE